MKRLNVMLLGAHINSSNLGCQALTYSLVHILELISSENGIPMDYYVFEYQPDPIRTKYFIEKTGLKDNNLYSYKFPFVVTLKNKIRNVNSILQILKVLKKTDIAIDVTAGDSFADIYGDERFLATTKIKRIVEKKGIPLLLAPQTYGPFEKECNEKYAAQVIRDAYRVITRDSFSAAYVKKITGLEIPVTTDLAFQLPYHRVSIESEKIKVGLNISGLLVRNAAETGFENELETVYDDYIDLLLKYLTTHEKYEVYLIPHVAQDYDACRDFYQKYPSVNLIRPFDNPMDVKSFISGMDIFVGARMHATIAAFTSGVVTIPTAYSRKFETMFSVVNYNVLVDLQTCNTEMALAKTIAYIEDYQELKIKTNESLVIAKKFKEKTKMFFSEVILKLGGES